MSELLDVADQIQLYYDNNIEGECEFTLATSELEAIDLSIYPNPSNGQFTINPNGVHVNRIVVRDMAGRTVYNENVDTNKIINLQLNTDKGIYIATVETILGNYSKTIVIE